MTAVTTRESLEKQKSKLAHSYHELLEEFSSKDLRTVGNYTLGRLIGKGSFGKVYLASHRLTNGSKVVLKSANKDDANLAREIHHHRQFRHPHIARLYEVIVTENLVWLVLEYCPGNELYSYLLRHGALPVEKVQRIFAQLVGAVAYVHNMSCVHRDLKLENILLDKHENVKLVDFGFTREYEGKLSYLQTFCGTICYSAPEMLKGEKYAGEKVDVWSLGVILFALLTGGLPFDDDNDTITKKKVMSEEPKYPDTIPQAAVALISRLLSKRPLHRPSISEILTNPFLAEHSPQQQAALKLTRPLPFTTDLEKHTLERMRSAGIDIEDLKENVLCQRCDALAGWWALLIEKEERKERRRERKRVERDIDAKHLRRLSARSARLERLAASLNGIDEETMPSPNLNASRTRGRQHRRSIPTPQLILPELPQLPEGLALDSPTSPAPLHPYHKETPISPQANTVRRDAPLSPEQSRRSHGSTMQLYPANSELATGPSRVSRKRSYGKRQHPFLSQLTSIKQWFKESAKRTKSPAPFASDNSFAVQAYPQDRNKQIAIGHSFDLPHPICGGDPAHVAPPREMAAASHTSHSHPLIPTPRNRSSLSPTPVTPRSSGRHLPGPGGLRGRKSTSSSVSSIRSIHHLPTHSKASSTSSTSNSIHSPLPFSRTSRSPHASVKVLPSTPTASVFPSNVRLVRSVNQNYNETAHFSAPTGLVFAKRRKTPFRGPGLTVGTSCGTSPSAKPRDLSAGPNSSRSASQPGRASGEIIEEEDEGDIEEVDAFSPTTTEAEEIIWAEAKDSEPEGWIRRKDMLEDTRFDAEP